uniref:Putative secreted protein n=1 Tax=Ixodes ricinus TaxID=34613 RepID=A0A6B0UPH6_IXORI
MLAAFMTGAGSLVFCAPSLMEMGATAAFFSSMGLMEPKVREKPIVVLGSFWTAPSPAAPDTSSIFRFSLSAPAKSSTSPRLPGATAVVPVPRSMANTLADLKTTAQVNRSTKSCTQDTNRLYYWV